MVASNLQYDKLTDMNKKLHKIAKFLTPVGVGFLSFLVIEGFWEHKEGGDLFSFETLILLIFVLVGIFLGKRLAKHIACGCNHNHSHDEHNNNESDGEKKIDFIFLFSVAFAGVFHTMIDGAVLGEVFGSPVFWVVLLSISLHELIRVSSLMVSLRDMGYTRLASFLSVPFSTIVGISIGLLLQNRFHESFESNAETLHFFSAGLYSLVITDLVLWLKSRFGLNKYNTLLIVIGFILAILLSVPHGH